MKRITRVIFVSLILCFSVSAQSLTAQRLQHVHKIYVGDLGESDGAKVIREKIITELSKSDRIAVVMNPEKADAYITGLAGVASTDRAAIVPYRGGYLGAAGTYYHASAVVRLVGADEKILWAQNADSNSGKSVSTNVAEKVAKELLKAIKKDDKTKTP
jgi:hypothetical protein